MCHGEQMEVAKVSDMGRPWWSRGWERVAEARQGMVVISEARVDGLARSARMGGGVAACAHGGWQVGAPSMAWPPFSSPLWSRQGRAALMGEPGVRGGQGLDLVH